jgi:hypothetical protein
MKMRMRIIYRGQGREWRKEKKDREVGGGKRE